MRFPGGKSKAFTLSYDDGVEQDEKLIHMLVNYNLKCTFNLNSGMYTNDNYRFEKDEWHRRFTKDKATWLYSKSCVEVASHAYTHAHIDNLPQSLIVGEFIKDREALESQFDKLVLGACYPYGCSGEKEIIAAQLAGLLYARSTSNTYAFNMPENWLHWNPSCSHNYPQLQDLTNKFICDEVSKSPYLFYVWGHTYEFDRDNNWHVIEQLFEKVSNNEDIWYATNGDIYQYVAAYNCLQYSCDGNMAHNPTATTVYLEVDFKLYEIKSGDTVKFL